MQTELDDCYDEKHRPKKLELFKWYCIFTIFTFTAVKGSCNNLVYDTQDDNRVKPEVISPNIAFLFPFNFALQFSRIER